MAFKQLWHAWIHWPVHLIELLLLLREQNSLLRELIQFHTRRPAQTPYSQAAPLRLVPPSPITPRGAEAVSAVSHTRRQEIAQEMEARLAAPWRSGEILPPPEAHHLSIPSPNRTDQPLPSGSAKTEPPTVA